MLNRVSKNYVQVVTVSQCKADMRITEDDQDVYISELIQEAIDYCEGPEGVIGVALTTQTWELQLPKFYDKIRLPLSPVQSLTSITYFDGDDAQQTLSSAYRLIKSPDEAFLERIESVTLPATFDRSDAVSVRFVAGYGDAADDVPSSIKRAIRILVAHMFDNPTVATMGTTPIQTPRAFDSLVDLHRRSFVG